jgi:hypothetical protein
MRCSPKLFVKCNDVRVGSLLHWDVATHSCLSVIPED